MRVAFVVLGWLGAVFDVACLWLFAVLGGVVSIAVAPAIMRCLRFWSDRFGAPGDLVG